MLNQQYWSEFFGKLILEDSLNSNVNGQSSEKVMYLLTGKSILGYALGFGMYSPPQAERKKIMKIEMEYFLLIQQGYFNLLNPFYIGGFNGKLKIFKTEFFMFFRNSATYFYDETGQSI